MTPLEKILAIVLIIGTIFGIIASIPTIINLINDPVVWNSGILQTIFVISMLGGIIAVYIIFIALSTRALQLLFHKLEKANLTVRLLEESKKYLGGELLFEVKFSAFLINGYFAITIRSPYLEEKITFVRYDDIKKLGQLQGKYKDRQIKLKCHIPSDFSSGEYDVKVEIFDVTTLLFSLRTTQRIIKEKIKIKISESKN